MWEQALATTQRRYERLGFWGCVRDQLTAKYMAVPEYASLTICEVLLIFWPIQTKRGTVRRAADVMRAVGLGDAIPPDALKPGAVRAGLMNVRAGRGCVTRQDVAMLREMADGACVYCAGPLGRMHVDHFVPLARGGENAVGNLVPACAACNLSKSARDPEAWVYAKHGEAALLRAHDFLLATVERMAARVEADA